MRNSFIIFAFLSFMTIICCPGCKPEKQNGGFTLRIRLREDVDCLHPILSKSSLATQIEPLIMIPMIEYSMDKIELNPLLVTELPKLTHSNDSASVFECDIRPEAKWDDGSPVRASDYAFTIKAALNPFNKNPDWRALLKNMKEIELNSNNPGHLSIHVLKNYLLSKEVCGNVNLYQEHYYDPTGIMNKFKVYDLINKDSAAWSPAERAELQKFADAFQTADMCKNKISGAGPYRLKSWDAGSKIILEKKADWWGSKLAATNPMLSAYPDRIEYLIMPDEASSILALKEGTIDIATDISPKQFDALQKDNSSKDKLQFFTPTVFQYAFLELNNRNPALSERAVRQSLARLADVSGFIKNVMQGLAEPIIGPFHPSRPYYNKGLKPIAFDPETAAKELQAAGWKDSNKDGILDKMINGKSVKLSFHLMASAESGKKFALLFQEAAKKVGIEIIPETKDWSLILKDFNELQFDMAIVIQNQSPSLYDPYQSWSSVNTKPGGSNRCGFATPETDSLIQIIRTTPSEQERNNAYLQFQEILYNEQPQIFLFSPKQRIISSSRIKLEASSRRPGFAENMIQLATK
jgi:peptide/nickel transport system substrate-binding protein